MRIYVFGSNLAGIHGKGDALTARQLHGAILRQGEGLQGQSYGIPTKDAYIRSLPLLKIQPGVERFLAFARAHPEMTFDVQRVGCRLAGYTAAQIAPFFAGAPENCFFHEDFRAVLRGMGAQFNDAAIPVEAHVLPDQGALF